MSESGHNTKVYTERGGDKLTVASGGTLAVDAGGTFTISGVSIIEGVTEAAIELLTTTPGTAEASKTVIADENIDVLGFRNLSFTGDLNDVSAAELDVLDGATAGTAVASKALVVDANVDIVGLRNIAQTGTHTHGGTDAAVNKGRYVSGTIAVTVPDIADAEIDSVAVSTAAMTFACAVGDAVQAIPLAALPTDCLLCGAYVTGADEVTVVFGAKEGGSGVSTAAVNFKFLFDDLT